MKNVTVYMGPMCAFCDSAKRLLKILSNLDQLLDKDSNNDIYRFIIEQKYYALSEVVQKL